MRRQNWNESISKWSFQKFIWYGTRFLEFLYQGLNFKIGQDSKIDWILINNHNALWIINYDTYFFTKLLNSHFHWTKRDNIFRVYYIRAWWVRKLTLIGRFSGIEQDRFLENSSKQILWVPIQFVFCSKSGNVTRQWARV